MSRIIMTKYFKRNEGGDFSDDGNRFKMYYLETPLGDIDISYLKADGQVYISPRGYDWKGDLTYSELREKCPSYADLDDYNGVSENEVDLERLVKVCNKFMVEVNEAKKNIEPIDLNAVNDYVNKYNSKLADLKKQVRKIVTLDYLITLDNYTSISMLEEYRRVMNTKEMSPNDLLNGGRAYVVEMVNKEPNVYVPYFISKKMGI